MGTIVFRTPPSVVQALGSREKNCNEMGHQPRGSPEYVTAQSPHLSLRFKGNGISTTGDPKTVGWSVGSCPSGRLAR